MIEEAPSLFKQARLAASFYSITVLTHHRTRRPHWNEIVEGVFLGAIPIESKVFSFGDHGNKLLKQCQKKGRPLKLVISANEQWELDGYGFLGLAPVPSEFWWKNSVTHRVLTFEDFGSKIPVDKIKEEVEAMKACVKEGGSAYVHCKAGRGRSFVILMCYLIDDLNLSPIEAFELLISKRAHVSPSISQFEMIEEYRATYKPDLEKLNLDSPIFTSYRKDLKGYMYSPMLHGTLVAAVTFTLGPEAPLVALLVSLLSGTTLGAVSAHTQAVRIALQKQSYITSQSAVGKSVNHEAFDAGVKAAYWGGWFKAWGNTQTYGKGNYEDYLAGLRAAQEKTNIPTLKAKL